MFHSQLDVWSIGLDGRTRVRELGECEALPRKWFTLLRTVHSHGLPITEAVIDSFLWCDVLHVARCPWCLQEQPQIGLSSMWKHHAFELGGGRESYVVCGFAVL